MPDSEEMLTKVKDDPEINKQLLLGVNLGKDVAVGMVRFIKTLINRIGNREMDGFGLNDQWTRAAADTLQAPLTAGVLVRSNILGSSGLSFFDRLMTVITPDAEVLAESLDIRHKYEEELTRLGRSERSEWAHLGDWDE